MKKYLLSLLPAFLLIGCASVPKITQEELDGLSTVSIAVVRVGDPKILYHLKIGDPSIGSEYSSQSEMHKAIYEKHGIKIGDIVKKKLSQGVTQVGNKKLVDKNGDLTLKVGIEYGFGPDNPFTTKLSPNIQIFVDGYIGEKEVWRDSATITIWSTETEDSDPTELVKNPDLIRNQYESVADLAINKILDDYKKVFVR